MVSDRFPAPVRYMTCANHSASDLCFEPVTYEIIDVEDDDYVTGYVCSKCAPLFNHLMETGARNPRPWLHLRPIHPNLPVE